MESGEQAAQAGLVRRALGKEKGRGTVLRRVSARERPEQGHGRLRQRLRGAPLAAVLLAWGGLEAAGAPPSGFAPAALAGRQLTLEGIDSSGISEEATVVFGEGGLFDATGSAAQGAAGDAGGSYSYRRTGPYTGTLTTRSEGPGHPSCTAHLTFTSATGGAYAASCADGSGRTGSFRMAHEDPFCRSLWDGLACGRAAALPHVRVGPAGGSTAATEVILGNTDPNPSACEVALLFHRGTSEAPPVRFNGRLAEGNLFQATLSREGAAIVTLTAPEAQQPVTGAVYVYARSPCTAGSLEIEGRTLIEEADGTVEELFSLASQSPGEWLGDGDCRVLAGVFGNGRDLGIAAVAARPGGRAPGGARLRFRAFDGEGGFIGAPADVSLTGAQGLFWPWEFSEPRVIEMCLEAPGTSHFQAAVMAIGSQTGGSRVQYASQGFTDAFRAGEATAWGVAGSSGGE